MRVAVFLAEGYEEIEALTVVDLLRRAEITTDIVRVPVEGEEVCCGHRATGSHAISVRADMTLDETDFDSLDMIVLPGGMPGTKNLEACEALCAQIRAFDAAHKKIAAICAAPGILGRMGLLEGRRAVSHPSAEASLTGATIPEDVPVCVDGHLITSRGMGTAIDFALAIIAELKDAESAKKLAEAICYKTA